MHQVELDSKSSSRVFFTSSKLKNLIFFVFFALITLIITKYLIIFVKKIILQSLSSSYVLKTSLTSFVKSIISLKKKVKKFFFRKKTSKSITFKYSRNCSTFKKCSLIFRLIFLLFLLFLQSLSFYIKIIYNENNVIKFVKIFNNFNYSKFNVHSIDKLNEIAKNRNFVQYNRIALIHCHSLKEFV